MREYEEMIDELIGEMICEISYGDGNSKTDIPSLDDYDGNESYNY